jgi:hypothetical protein
LKTIKGNQTVSLTPKARTLARLRRLGYLADVCERWLPRAHRRRDLFGLADVIAVHRREPGVLLVQATTAAHAPDRLARARGRPELPAWLRAGGAFEVWGWAKRGGRWHVRRVAARPGDLAPVELSALPRGRRPRKGERQRGLFDGEAGRDDGTRHPGSGASAGR